MAKLSNRFGNYVITYGADFMLCTRFGTGRFCVDDPFAVAVTLGRNNFLSNENFFTYRAVLTFGKTGFGAGRFNSGINYFGVPLCRDFCNLALF